MSNDINVIMLGQCALIATLFLLVSTALHASRSYSAAICSFDISLNVLYLILLVTLESNCGTLSLLRFNTLLPEEENIVVIKLLFDNNAMLIVLPSKINYSFLIF